MKTFSKRVPALSVIVTAAVVLAGAALIASCAGTPANGGSGGSSSSRNIKSSKRVPDFVQEARRNVPEDAFIGVGTARLSTDNQSMNMAGARARRNIAFQISDMVDAMIKDFTASSEIDPSTAAAYQAEFGRNLTSSTLRGAVVVAENFDDTGAYWAVVRMLKADVKREVDQNAAKSKLASAKKMAELMERDMDARIEAQAQKDVQVVENE